MRLTVGAIRSSVTPSGNPAPADTPAPARTIGTPVSVDAPPAGHGARPRPEPV
jgi:hypothetical protein